MKLSIPILTGQCVQLERLGEQHRDQLRVAADDERIWQHTLVCGRGAGFDAWFDEALAQRDAGRQIPFAVRRRTEGALLGSTSFLDVTLQHKRIEIGSTWYVPAVWGTRVNPECKLLLMMHAFEVLGVNRVAYVTDLLNERSQAAIAKLGAVREGVLRCDKITQGNRVRDTVVFSIIRSEWPGVKERLLARLDDHPSSA
jgi:RimJ/RimL family protein N-acetyltransferase